MRILDCSAGYRAVWFNRIHPDVVYLDIRPEVKPNVIADSTQLPFPRNTFDLIVWDPPHLSLGENSDMGKRYGSWSAVELKRMIKATGIEAYRVTKSEAWMAFKWADHDTRLANILKPLTGWEPLFGAKVATRSKHRSSTYWVLLRKRPIGYQYGERVPEVLSLPFPEDAHV